MEHFLSRDQTVARSSSPTCVLVDLMHSRSPKKRAFSFIPPLVNNDNHSPPSKKIKLAPKQAVGNSPSQETRSPLSPLNPNSSERLPNGSGGQLTQRSPRKESRQLGEKPEAISDRTRWYTVKRDIKSSRMQEFDFRFS